MEEHFIALCPKCLKMFRINYKTKGRTMENADGADIITCPHCGYEHDGW